LNNKNLKCIFDPLSELIAYYADSKTSPVSAASGCENLPIEEKLKRRIIDGDKLDIDKDLSTALQKYDALGIINDILLNGMKTVGELFASGEMQLPFVLQSAETMKTAVSFLEPYLDKIESKDGQKGTMVLATVKGDVHDIGKNLVDIILTNNGFNVINLGIKCPLENMLSAYHEYNADAIGMSGLLVKSTAIMKENLELMNERELKIPVILGGAALNRRFVEGELREMYNGMVFYANDAFDGLKYMNQIMDFKIKNIVPDLKIYKDNREPVVTSKTEFDINFIIKERLNKEVVIPKPPFWGSRIVNNIPLDKIYEYINTVALFKGNWNVYKNKNKSDEEYDKLIKNEILPKFIQLKLQAKREKLLKPQTIYGFFPCNSEGDDLIIYKDRNNENLYSEWNSPLNPSCLDEWVRFNFPRQKKDKFLCISDYFKSKTSGIIDVAAFQIVTVGNTATEYAQKLYNDNKYQDYLYFHGFSVESAEALAEYWHKIIRKELSIDNNDSPELKKIFQQGYQGSRYSFGYPACPALEDNTKLFELLKPERIGVTLTEEFQMVPEQSTNAIIVHREDAKYFFVR